MMMALKDRLVPIRIKRFSRVSPMSIQIEAMAMNRKCKTRKCKTIMTRYNKGEYCIQCTKKRIMEGTYE